MKQVYNQPYTKKRATTCWYGNPPKDVFKYDVIRIRVPSNMCKTCSDILYVTPDEAACLIRALSAGLHHFLVKDKNVNHIIKEKSKAEKNKS